MIVAAHQPGYLPWLGYFHKIARADLFVLLDDVQYERNGYQNRNRIKLHDGAHWLTVPVARGRLGERICDKRIVDGAERGWRRRTWLTIEQSYRRAPYFERHAEPLRAAFLRRWERLVELDLHLLGLLLGWLDLRTPMLCASTLALRSRRSERIAELCVRLGADTYLAGGGGSLRYLDERVLAAAGVRVRWQRFAHPIYPQLHPAVGFLPRMSALDLLFNCGPASREVLLSSTEERGTTSIA
jgi:hypothetical protein